LECFVPPDASVVLQVEKERAEISGCEIALWGSIDFTRLPSSAMPASLVFLLRFLSLSDTLKIEGSTMLLKAWLLPELCLSIGQVVQLLLAKYEGSILLFLSMTLAASNLIQKSPLNPLNIGRHLASGFATALDAIDLSRLTFDSEYVEERKTRKDSQQVDSLQEGVETATKLLFEGFLEGISDVVKQPVKEHRKKGFRGLPVGLCRGFFSVLFKPLDAIRQCLRALLQGVAACCICHFRRQPQRSRQHPNSREASRGDFLSHDPGSVEDYNVNHVNSGNSENAGLHIVPGTTRSHLESPTEPIEEHPLMMGHIRNSEPALHGAAGLRAPRLLFGERGTLRPFVYWHAELLLRLGPTFTREKICAAWRLAGSASDVTQIVLCMSHARLLLVDLNRNCNSRSSTALLDASCSHVLSGKRLQWNQFSTEALQQRRRTFSHDFSNKAVGWGLIRSALRCLSLSWCRWRSRASNAASIEKPLQVLGSWRWHELAQIQIVDPIGDRRFAEDPEWWLCVEDILGNITDCPLLAPVSMEELENVCNFVNQAIADLHSF